MPKQRQKPVRRPISPGSSIDISDGRTPEPEASGDLLPNALFEAAVPTSSYQAKLGSLNRISQEAAAYLSAADSNNGVEQGISDTNISSTHAVFASALPTRKPQRPSLAPRLESNATSRRTSSYHTAPDNEHDVSVEASGEDFHAKAKTTTFNPYSQSESHPGELLEYSSSVGNTADELVSARQIENDPANVSSLTSESSLGAALQSFPKPVARRSIHEVRSQALSDEAPTLPQIDSGGLLISDDDFEHAISPADIDLTRQSTLKAHAETAEQVLTTSVSSLDPDLKTSKPETFQTRPNLLPALSYDRRSYTTDSKSCSETASSAATLIDRKATTLKSFELSDSPLQYPKQVPSSTNIDRRVSAPSSAPPTRTTFQAGPLPQRGVSNQPRALIRANHPRSLSMPPAGSQFLENFVTSPTSTLTPLAQSTNTQWWMPPAAPKLSPDENAYAPLPPTERKSSSVLQGRKRSSILLGVVGRKHSSAATSPSTSYTADASSPMAPKLCEEKRAAPLQRPFFGRTWVRVALLGLLFVGLPGLVALVVWLAISSTT